MIRLKPLHEQVMVIMGASSGIGRETALQCAARGAKVVVAARSVPGLVSLVEEIESIGGEATCITCDVSDLAQVTAVADHAVARFGRIDTWVHAASVGVYATVEDVPLDDFRRVIEVNVEGSLYGAKAALPHLRREGRGVLIFITSIESTVSMPLQGAYATSKHAIQGLVETLRRELRAERVSVSVTSIKPGVISTPFYDNARSLVGFLPTVPPPAYHPAIVAACVLYAAEHPVRDLYAGGSARVMTLFQLVAPSLVDAILGRFGIPLQRTDQPPTDDAVYAPRAHDNRIEGRITSHPFRLSPYTWLQLHPKAKALGTVLAGAAIIRLRKVRRR